MSTPQDLIPMCRNALQAERYRFAEVEKANYRDSLLRSIYTMVLKYARVGNNTYFHEVSANILSSDEIVAKVQELFPECKIEWVVEDSTKDQKTGVSINWS